MSTTNARSIGRLLPKEICFSLREELAADRANADAEIAWIIAEARKHVVYLSSGIFLPLETIEEHLADGAAAVERMKAEGRHPDSVAYRVCAGAYHDTMVEYAVAQAIRAARLPVSYADAADYWERRYERATAGR